MAFHFLLSPLRQELEQTLRGGEHLILFWLHLANFTLFERLYGEEISGDLLEQVNEVLPAVAREVIDQGRRVHVDRLEPGSFLVLAAGGSKDLGNLYDLALGLKLGIRNALYKPVVQLTGQSLTVNAGFSLVEDRPGMDLEYLLYNGLCDARQVAEGDLDLSRVSLMGEFRRLLETEAVSAVYQPIVDLETSDVLGWESLARGPEGSNFQSPGIMFDFAEEVGSIFELEGICRQAAVKGLGRLAPGQKLFLNIHPHTLGDPKFQYGQTRELLQRHGLYPGNVVFEITERHSIKDFTLFHRTLDHYRGQGYLVAIDDAGTGYSGLTRIARLRPEFIKVDMDLIRGIDTNPVQRALLETLITFADKIGSAIVAEGIETEAELASLVAMGAHYGQGYYLARPAAPKPQPRQVAAPASLRLGRGAGWEVKCGLPVADLAEVAPQAAPTTLVREVKALLDHQPISGLVVVEEDRPVGLVMSHLLDKQLGTLYGTSLYYEKPVTRVMDSAPLMVDGATPVEIVAKKAMCREHFKIYDHIIVTREGRLLGLVSVQKMLDALARVQVEMAKGANPLTGLPGNVSLEREVEARCGSGAPTSVIYVDLDHFKVYNDVYGFKSGDRMILMLSKVLLWAAERHGRKSGYVAHVGGDDFVVISSPETAERICRGVVRVFGRVVRALYNPEDRQAGYVHGKDRNGQNGRFPLTTVSLAIVDCRGPVDMGQIGHRAAEVKGYAKSRPGNVFVRDRRRPLGLRPDKDDPCACARA